MRLGVYTDERGHESLGKHGWTAASVLAWVWPDWIVFDETEESE